MAQDRLFVSPAPGYERVSSGRSITVPVKAQRLILPTGDLDKLPGHNEFIVDPNRCSIAETPFGGLKCVRPHLNAGSLYMQTANVSITDLAGANAAQTKMAQDLKSASLLSVDTSAKTISEEFVVRNDATNNSQLQVDLFTVATGWNTIFGSEGSASIDNGRLKLSGKTDAGGLLIFNKTGYSVNATNYNFMKFDYEANADGSFYTFIGSDVSANYARWLDKAPLTNVTANTPVTVVLPIKAPSSSSGANPNGVIGTVTWSNVSEFRFGFKGSPNTTYTFYVDNLYLDVGKSFYLEMSVPDSLADTSLMIQTWGGSSYLTALTCKLDQSYSAVSSTGANYRLLDGTKLEDVFGSGSGRVLYPKGANGATVSGASGTMTYSTNNYTNYCIGIRIVLPPSDNGRTNFNQIRLKTTLYYSGVNYGLLGAPGTLYTPTAGCQLTSITGTNPTNLLTAGALAALGNLTVDTTNKTISEEFILVNTSTSNSASPPTIVSAASASGWTGSADMGTVSSITSDGTKITVSGTSNASGYLAIYKIITAVDLTNYKFAKFNYVASANGSIYLAMGSTSTDVVAQRGVTATAVTANTARDHVFAFKGNVGTVGCVPTVSTGSPAWNGVTFVRVGFIGSPNTAYTFTFSSLTADIGKWCYVEVHHPDNMQGYPEEAKINGFTWNIGGTPAYSGSYFFGSYNSDGKQDGADGFGYYLDGTTARAMYGQASDYTQVAAVMYKRGMKGDVKSRGSYCDAGVSTYTYTSTNPGSKYRTAFCVLMPPNDGWSNSNKMRIKLVQYYTDINGNLVPCVSPANSYGTTWGGVTKLSTGLKFAATGGVNFGHYVPPSKFGVFAKFKTTASVSSPGEAIVNYKTTSNTTDKGFFLHSIGGKASVRIADGTNAYVKITDTVVNDGNNHIAIWNVDREAGTAKLYVDGILIDTGNISSITGSIEPGATLPMAAGALINGGTQINQGLLGYIYFAGVKNGLITDAEMTSINAGKVEDVSNCQFCIRPEAVNSGATTFDFTYDDVPVTGLLRTNKPWLALVDSSGQISYLVFSKRPSLLSYLRDDSGDIYELTFDSGNSLVYRGSCFLGDLTTDSDGDYLPNCLEEAVEASLGNMLKNHDFNA